MDLPGLQTEILGYPIGLQMAVCHQNNLNGRQLAVVHDQQQ